MLASDLMYNICIVFATLIFTFVQILIILAISHRQFYVYQGRFVSCDCKWGILTGAIVDDRHNHARVRVDYIQPGGGRLSERREFNAGK